MDSSGSDEFIQDLEISKASLAAQIAKLAAEQAQIDAKIAASVTHKVTTSKTSNTLSNPCKFLPTTNWRPGDLLWLYCSFSHVYYRTAYRYEQACGECEDFQ